MRLLRIFCNLNLQILKNFLVKLKIFQDFSFQKGIHVEIRFIFLQKDFYRLLCNILFLGILIFDFVVFRF